METIEKGEITRLLQSWHQGGGQAPDELWHLVYAELRGLARRILRSRGRRASQQPTSLVHQAYLRLLGADVEWTDRRHFFAVAARAMRFVLADEARRQLAQKRGAGDDLPLADVLVSAAGPLARRPEEVLAVHEALERLARVHPRYEKLVEMRYFAGLSVVEAAKILEVTPRTVVRDWKAVKVWLHSELTQASSSL